MIDSICQAMSMYQFEGTIYADFNEDAFNVLIENQLSNIVKLMSRLGIGESIQEKVWLVLSGIVLFDFSIQHLTFYIPLME